MALCFRRCPFVAQRGGHEFQTEALQHLARGHDEVLSLILSDFVELARFIISIIDGLHADQTLGSAPVFIEMIFVGESCFFKFDQRSCGCVSPDVIDCARDVSNRGQQITHRNRNCESGSPVRTQPSVSFIALHAA